MEKPNISIEKLNLTEEPSVKLISFLQNIFPGINKTNWEWEYKKSPAGEGIVWIAKVDNLISVHYAFIILSFIYKNRIIKVAKAEGSLADINILKKLPPEERRLFKRTVDLALEDLKKQKIDFIYGFPNKKAIKSQISSGYDLIKMPFNFSRAILNINPILKEKTNNKIYYKILTFILNILLNTIYKPYLKYRAKNNIQIKRLSKIHTADIKKFFYKWTNLNSEIISMNRSWDFYQWRYQSNPYRKHEVSGFFNNDILEGIIVCAIEEYKGYKRGHIMEISYLNKNSLSKLLRWSLDWAYKKNVYSIDIWSEKENNLLLNNLLRNGFLTKKNNTKNMIIKILDNKINISELKWSIHRYLERI